MVGIRHEECDPRAVERTGVPLGLLGGAVEVEEAVAAEGDVPQELPVGVGSGGAGAAGGVDYGGFVAGVAGEEGEEGERGEGDGGCGGGGGGRGRGRFTPGV